MSSKNNPFDIEVQIVGKDISWEEHEESLKSRVQTSETIALNHSLQEFFIEMKQDSEILQRKFEKWKSSRRGNSKQPN